MAKHYLWIAVSNIIKLILYKMIYLKNDSGECEHRSTQNIFNDASLYTQAFINWGLPSVKSRDVISLAGRKNTRNLWEEAHGVKVEGWQ